MRRELTQSGSDPVKAYSEDIIMLGHATRNCQCIAWATKLPTSPPLRSQSTGAGCTSIFRIRSDVASLSSSNTPTLIDGTILLRIYLNLARIAQCTRVGPYSQLGTLNIEIIRSAMSDHGSFKYNRLECERSLRHLCCRFFSSRMRLN